VAALGALAAAREQQRVGVLQEHRQVVLALLRAILPVH
jgi:hypothetical protein